MSREGHKTFWVMACSNPGPYQGWFFDYACRCGETHRVPIYWDDLPEYRDRELATPAHACTAIDYTELLTLAMIQWQLNA